MSDEEIEKLGGLPKWKINEAIKAVETRMQTVERYIWPQGEPDLEKRMTLAYQAADTHKHANAINAVQNIDYKLTREIEHLGDQGDERHKQAMDGIDNTGKKVDAASEKMERSVKESDIKTAGLIKGLVDRMDGWQTAGFAGAVALIGVLAMQIFSMIKGH